MSKLVQIRSTHGPVGHAAAAPSVTDGAETIPPTGPRVYLETLGCQMNEADSAIIMGQLRARGYRRVDDPAAADVILLNTCAVREKAGIATRAVGLITDPHHADGLETVGRAERGKFGAGDPGVDQDQTIVGANHDRICPDPLALPDPDSLSDFIQHRVSLSGS